jgi:Flp pilus assembly protein TadD
VILRLKDPLGACSDVAGMCSIRQGAEAEQRGQAGIAESKYREAKELLPKLAAAPYRLARLFASLGRIEDGRQLYGQAVELDSSYRNAYSSGGFHHYWRGELADAEREFHDLLTLDPSDAYCQLGLGLLALKRNLLTEAEQRLRTALMLDNCLLDAQCDLGETLAKLGRRKEAILAYERALMLLGGDKTHYGPILLVKAAMGKLGEMNWIVPARLASLYAEEGDTEKALSALEFSITNGGPNSTRLRWKLACLYWKKGQWRDFVLQGWQVINMAPKVIWAVGWRNLQRTVH